MSYDLMTETISEIPVIFGNRKMNLGDIIEAKYNLCIFKDSEKIYSEEGISPDVIASALIAKGILDLESLNKLNAKVLLTK